MPIEFKWHIVPVNIRVKEVNGNPDTVLQVSFRVTATEGGHSAYLDNHVNLTPSENGSFTPFEQLTEQQVLGWVKEALTADRIAKFEHILTAEINYKKNPPVPLVSKPAPWNTCTQQR